VTTTASGSDETRARTLAVASAAFGRFADALANGTWAPFLACITDDFEFWFPAGRFKGRHAGKAAAADFFAYVSTVYPGGLFVTLDRVMASETSVAFEFRDAGLLFGREPYANRVVIVLDVRGDRLCGYREYFGSDGTP
jgi:ketosteroid isomerase-like protein